MSNTDSPNEISYSDLTEMSVGRLSGVGPARQSALASLGIENLLDLLTHFPRRYIDRSSPRRIRDLKEGESSLVLATLRCVETRRTRSRRVMVNATFADGSGTIRCSFFNQPWRQRQLEAVEGVEVALYGKVERFNGRAQMTNPLVDMIGDQTGRIVPIYPMSEKVRLTSGDVAALVSQTLRRCRQRGICDPVPDSILKAHDLVPREDALNSIHFPETMAQMVIARRRLVFDELLRIQVSLVGRKRQIEREQMGFRHLPNGEGARPEDLLGEFYRSLPYELTGAQRRAIAEIAADMTSPVPMHRLLQGDVGAGKTLVALVALLTAVKAGHQGAFMAPTEVLAEQHTESLRALVGHLRVGEAGSLLGDRPVTVGLLSGRVRVAERRRILEELDAGRMDILVGTHALLEESVRFRSLGLVVIDEQHRFGVEQRDSLRAGERHPDVLVMTATPIPRTAAMTVYGDLDMTILDELPPGRTPVETIWASSISDQDDTWSLVREQVSIGRQTYVVCPLVEGSEKIQAASAEQTRASLAEGELSGLAVGLLHGRMSSDDKDEVMGAFRERRLDVLVATTVIEVGVDVPNATVMVILDADRFGLAQLHQLRGRVGRGSDRSYCVLVSGEAVSEEGSERLGAMVATTDGFKLAEVDLELRGEGTIMGQRQKGRSDLRLASLSRDGEWIEKARASAFDLIDSPEHAPALLALTEETSVFIAEEEAEFLEKN